MWVTPQNLQLDDPLFPGLMSGQPAFSFAEGFNVKMLDRGFGEKERSIEDPGGRLDLNARLEHLKMSRLVTTSIPTHCHRGCPIKTRKVAHFIPLLYNQVGRVAEWFNASVLKTDVAERLPRVRLPLLPPGEAHGRPWRDINWKPLDILNLTPQLRLWYCRSQSRCFGSFLTDIRCDGSSHRKKRSELEQRVVDSLLECPCDGIGRHASFRNSCLRRVGSSPTGGNEKMEMAAEEEPGASRATIA